MAPRCSKLLDPEERCNPCVWASSESLQCAVLSAASGGRIVVGILIFTEMAWKNHHLQSKPRDPWRPKDEGFWKDHSYLIDYLLCYFHFVAPASQCLRERLGAVDDVFQLYFHHIPSYIWEKNDSKIIVILNHSTKVLFTSIYPWIHIT